MTCSLANLETIPFAAKIASTAVSASPGRAVGKVRFGPRKRRSISSSLTRSLRRSSSNDGIKGFGGGGLELERFGEVHSRNKVDD